MESLTVLLNLLLTIGLDIQSSLPELKTVSLLQENMNVDVLTTVLRMLRLFYDYNPLSFLLERYTMDSPKAMF